MSHLAIVGLACDYEPGGSDAGCGLDAFARSLYLGMFPSTGDPKAATTALETVVANLLDRVGLDEVVAPARTGVIVCAAGDARVVARQLSRRVTGDP